MEFTRLLLIDDDSDDQEFFTSSVQLLSANLRCTVMSDPVVAFNTLKQGLFRPDIIFLDLNMPKMTGEDFLTRIKKLDLLKYIPVVIFTTSSDPQTMERMTDLGAHGFLVKPTALGELVKKLSDMLETVQSLVGGKAKTANPRFHASNPDIG